MSEKVRVKVQGLMVEITVPPDIRNYRKTSVGIEFPCKCGTNRLSVTSANFPIDDWERLIEARRQAEAWKKATEKASDFVDYYIRMDKVRKRFERFGLLWTSGIFTQSTVTCHTCKRSYRFPLSVVNPISAERLTPFEVYQRYPLKNTKGFQKAIAEWIHSHGGRHEPPIETAADYIKYLKDLETAPEAVKRFAENIRKTIEAMRRAENNVVLDVWLEDLTGSFDGAVQDFEAYCEKQLKRHVEELANLVAEPTRLRIPAL